MDDPTSIRDERKLKKNTDYVFFTDGFVNYRAMLKPEHLCFNSQKAEAIASKIGVSADDIKSARTVTGFSLEKIEDSDLLILLSGIKYLASLRGYKNVINSIIKSEYNIATVECRIDWIPNFESDYKDTSYSSVSTATLDNTSGFGNLYLTEIAENRAFSRAVRNYLNINIVSNDEIGPDKPISRIKKSSESEQAPATILNPKDLLEQNIKKLNLTFDKFKDIFIAKYRNNPKPDKNVNLEGDPNLWKGIEDISENDIYTLLNILSKK